MTEVDIAEQKRLLTDPARSFETPAPTPEGQLKEAAIAGLTEASAKEVWEQTRALIMTEVLDAVSRDDLLEKLGPEPGEGDTIVIDDDGKEVSEPLAGWIPDCDPEVADDEFYELGSGAEDRANQEIGFGWDPDTIGLDVESEREEEDLAL